MYAVKFEVSILFMMYLIVIINPLVYSMALGVDGAAVVCPFMTAKYQVGLAAIILGFSHRAQIS